MPKDSERIINAFIIREATAVNTLYLIFFMVVTVNVDTINLAKPIYYIPRVKFTTVFDWVCTFIGSLLLPQNLIHIFSFFLKGIFDSMWQMCHFFDDFVCNIFNINCGYIKWLINYSPYFFHRPIRLCWIIFLLFALHAFTNTPKSWK